MSLHLACSQKDPPLDIITNLIISGADVNSADQEGKTPLHCMLPSNIYEAHHYED